MLTCYFQMAGSFDAQNQKERQGEEGAAGLVFVSEMGFNRNTFICVILHALFPLCSHRSNTSVKVSLRLVKMREEERKKKKELSHKRGTGDVKLFAGKSRASGF